MTTDLEQLMRDTFAERGNDITDAPAWDAGAAHRPADRARWVPVAAAAAAVVIVGGGITAWQAGRDGGGQTSGGGYARSCPTTLPKAWTSAFTAPPLTTGGALDNVAEVTPYGDVVEQVTKGGGTRVGLRLSNGPVRVLYQVTATVDLTGTSADGRTLVLSLAPASAAKPGTTVDDIVAIDVRTSAVRHVLATAHQPSGTVVADKAAKVLDGTVYWTAVPRGSAQDAKTGTVLAYHLAEGRTEVVGHAPNLLSGPDDPRGVYWTGGGVPAAHVPASVPGLRVDGYDPAVSDGANFAWLRSAAPDVIGWADAAGDERRWSVEIPGRSGVRADPVAVSGAFVFLEPQGVGDLNLFVLDTRTGALADSGIPSFGAHSLGNRVVVTSRSDDQAPFTSVAIDTAHLPRLTCSRGR